MLIRRQNKCSCGIIFLYLKSEKLVSSYDFVCDAFRVGHMMCVSSFCTEEKKPNNGTCMFKYSNIETRTYENL